MEAFVQASPNGYYAPELTDVLHVEVQEPLRHLVRQQHRLSRSAIGGRFLYTSMDSALRRRRADQRDQEARGASGGNRSPLPQTTLAYYVQSVEESQRSAITRLEKIMFPTVPKFEDGSLLIQCKDWLGD
ncbi:MAG: hypothetical protein DMG56_14590 [Acidobacteria bacterium]|nr:MAG: hypothetical protein DMG56_14590 [Acidobacteriota bacterium]